MRSIGTRARAAISFGMVTSSFSMTRDSRIFGSVMRFICGQRLQGRTKLTLGASTATLSLRAFGHEQHLGRLMVVHPFDHAAGRAGEIGFGEHVGGAFGVGDDL